VRAADRSRERVIQRVSSSELLLLGGTRAPSSLAVRLACDSRSVGGKRNEDWFAVSHPNEAGVLLAVADGISTSGAGLTAAQAAIQGLLIDSYAAAQGLPTVPALDRVLHAANRWMWTYNEQHADSDASVVALSLLVLWERAYCLAHVGDTRIYQLRDSRLRRLTADHVWRRADLRHVLRRGIGLDSHLVVDYEEGELKSGDIWLLVTDGVWEVLGDERMQAILRSQDRVEHAAAALVEAAYSTQAAYLGRNDATAIVAKIVDA